MTPGRWFRYAPLLGALFVILVLAGFVVAGDTPGTDALPAEIKDKYDDQAKHLIGLYLVALGGVALLFFASHLRGALRLLDPFGRMANAAFAGAVTSSGGIHGLLRLPWRAHRCRRPEEVSGQALQALNALDNWSFVPITAGIGVLMISTAIAIIRGGRLIPGWFGWLGVIIGIVGLSPLGFFGTAAAALWLVALSVLLYVRWETLHREAMAPAVPPGPLPT